MPLAYEPLSRSHWADPYPVYRELRESAPLHRAPETGTYCLSRHADVAFALRNPVLFSSAGMAKMLFHEASRRPRLRDLAAMARFLLRARVNPLRERRDSSLITQDPPIHDALRDIVNRGFTPRRIATWEPRMREIVAGCMGKLHAGEPFDVISDLAIPLPVTVIAEMLGIEPGRQRDFKRWSDALVAASSGGSRDAGLRGILDPMGEARGYLRRIVRERRARPADDLISVLVDPRHESTLGEREVFGFIVLLLVAGNETTTNLVGNAALALLRHPEELAKVQAEPGLVPSLIEETLRWESPVQLLFRETTAEAELPSGRIPAGAPVALLLGSANRDPAAFEEPDRFDVRRDPRGHLAFGLGVHFCLGASLARLEAKVALEVLVSELPLTAEAPKAELVDSFLVRGPRSLYLPAAC
jgi:cytochrome P450